MTSIIAKRKAVHGQLVQQQRRNEALEKDMVQLEALANLGSATAMIAHEINNLLTPLTNYAELSLKHLDDRELAERTLTRTRSLYQEGLVSAQELESAQAALQAAQAASQSSAAAVSQRQVQLQYFAVKAPLAGTVGDVLVRVGDFVTASTPLTTVAQTEVLEVSVALPAERAREVKVGTPVEILGADGAVLVRCELYFVAPQADAKSQLVDVKAVFKNAVGLRPNELVRTRLVYGVRNALQIPALAVTRQSGQTFVFAVSEKDGKTVVARKPVTLGPLGETDFVVEAGLGEGDRIAVSSLQALRDGAPIKPRPVPSLAGRN